MPISIKKEDDNYYALKIKGDSDEATVKKVYKLDDVIEFIALNPSYPSKKFTNEDIKTIPAQVIVKQLIKNY